MMELLQKFAAVEIQADCRITEMDKDYCVQHQKAYETALSSFQELAFFWEDMKKAQQELLGDSNSPFFHNYLVAHEGSSISRQLIDNHIQTLHVDFIMTLEDLKDLARIKPGDFVLVTLNKLGMIQRHIKKWVRRHNQNIMLVLDESDEISNPYSKRAKASLSCFRRCRMKLLTTGTSTRNNISEFAPQLELLYNNSINMITWCRDVYSYNKDSEYMDSDSNAYYGRPIPAYKRGYAHLQCR